MRKAYNVYTINEKTSIRAAFRKFTLLFAFGVCFLGFQTQGSSQTFTAVAPNSANIDQSFLRGFDFAVAGEDAATVLRNQKRLVMQAPARTDAEDLDSMIKLKFLSSSIQNIMAGQEIRTALGGAYVDLASMPIITNNTSNYDFQGVVEGYARLLD